MLIKEQFKLSYKNIFQNKKRNLINISLFSISFLIIFICFFLYSTINGIVYDNVNKNMAYRTLSISYDMNRYNFNEVSKYFLKKDYVNDVFKTNLKMSYVFSKDLKNEMYDGWINVLYSDNNTLPSIKKGNNYSKATKYEMICPTHFIPISNPEKVKSISKNDYIKEDLLNKNIEVEFNLRDYSDNEVKILKKIKRKVKIVGLYDSNENMMLQNQCFIPKQFMKEIIKYEEGNMNEFQSNNSSNILPSLIISDSKYVEEVIEYGNQAGFIVRPSVTTDDSLYLVIKTMTLILALLLTFIIIFILKLSTVKNINNRKQEISIYKAIGFKNKLIIRLLNLENNLIIFISYLISLILYGLIYLVIYYILNYTPLSLQAVINLRNPAIIVLLLPSIIIITSIFNKHSIEKTLNFDTISQLKE